MKSLNTAAILQLLQFGTLEVEGFLPWSSNYTFLVKVANHQAEALAVYKPRRGERPLWDFTQGTLCQREQAAFVVSDMLGWNLVPPTVMREGPHGLGSMQLFIEHDPESHYFTFEGEAAFQQQLQQITLFDIIINNADRKGGHILLEQSVESAEVARLWAIDHGVCFHTSHKLRTVVWEFAGARIPPHLLADLVRFRDRLYRNSDDYCLQLKELLTETEVKALQRRMESLIKRGCFWEPGPGRHYPWPPV